GFVLPCAYKAFCCAAVLLPSLNMMYKPFLYACLIKSSPYFQTTGWTLPTRFLDLLIRVSTLIIYHPSVYRSLLSNPFELPFSLIPHPCLFPYVPNVLIT